MKEMFQTFKPKNALVERYVSYYYLDIKPHNKVTKFQCFPHFNTTISIYKSHIRLATGEMKYESEAKPFQIFTPIRENVLQVVQSGPIYRIVLVFKPLGIQQFFEDLNFCDYIKDFDFFQPSEVADFFSTLDVEVLTNFLDQSLVKRIQKTKYPVLQDAIDYSLEATEFVAVGGLAEKLNVSRQHLNRLFRSHFGVSTKKFLDIVLFRKSINKKLFENPSGTFTELTYDLNFSDQSHFTKTYKSLTAHSPKFFFNNGTVLGEEDTFWHLKS